MSFVRVNGVLRARRVAALPRAEGRYGLVVSHPSHKN
jgi:hypothetical protein